MLIIYIGHIILGALGAIVVCSSAGLLAGPEDREVRDARTEGPTEGDEGRRQEAR